jgi:threonine/homoserine/homoserine lactone efflux protein
VKELKNIVVGFLVSFIGSIPFGYLNCIGFEIYSKKGAQHTIEYLIGVIIIEAFVIYITLHFSNYLLKQSQWIKKIEIFTILFLTVLGSLFFFNNKQYTSTSIYINYNSFLTGIILSCLNFIQLPFWSGWNLYLINNKHVTIDKGAKFYYLLGTLIGTFSGMMGFILSLNYLHDNVSKNFQEMIMTFIPILFFILAIIQCFKFYKKHYLKKH